MANHASPYVLDTSTTGTHTYTVVAVSKDGLSSTSTITYTVNPQVNPMVTEDPPYSETATAGSSLTFTVSANGTPVPTVQWQLSVNGGITWLDIPGTTTTLTTGPLTIFENGWGVRAVFTNSAGSAATSAATISIVPPTTSVLLPSGGATVSGSQYLDAIASPGVSEVQYELTGGSLTDSVIAKATSTLYGWLASWDTTSVPNGTYTLQSVASFGGLTGTSPPISITVNNPAPATTVIVPADGATLSGHQYLDAVASAGVSQVKYDLTGGTLSGPEVIATAAPTLYGWLAAWNTTTVPDGTYTVQSVASYAGGVSGTSPGITITVNN